MQLALYTRVPLFDLRSGMADCPNTLSQKPGQPLEYSRQCGIKRRENPKQPSGLLLAKFQEGHKSWSGLRELDHG
ncbi:uncharacterized [Tachysurus ichikawai]